MDRVWYEEEERVTCAHPGTPLVSGRSKVMDSWRQILGGGAPEIAVENSKVRDSGLSRLALRVTCLASDLPCE